MNGNNRWLVRLTRDRSAKVRVVCFPHAGGGASFFVPWRSALPESVELVAVQPPGREDRLREAPIDDWPTLMSDLVAAVAGELGERTVFLGHSLGALLAFELARVLDDRGGPAPLHLFVCGRNAPHLPDQGPDPENLDDRGLIRRLRQLGGTPAEVLLSRELMELVMPVLRADLTLAKRYRCEGAGQPDCPITVYGGLRDPETDESGLRLWARHTKHECSLRMFPGDHFFLVTHRRSVIQALSSELRRYLG